METLLRSYRITPAQAMEKVRATLLAHGAGVVGFDRRLWDQSEESARAFEETSCYARWRRGDEEVTLHVDLRRDRVELGTKFAGKEKVDCSVWEVQVNVSWSSTHRSPARARAAVVLYGQVTDVALAIEAEMEGEQVAVTREEERAQHEAEEKARLAAQVHAPSFTTTLATICALSASDMAGGARGTVIDIPIVPAADVLFLFPVDTGCPSCRRALQNQAERDAKKAAREAKKAAGGAL